MALPPNSADTTNTAQSGAPSATAKTVATGPVPSKKASRKKTSAKKSPVKKAASKKTAAKKTPPSKTVKEVAGTSLPDDVATDPIPASLQHMPVTLFSAGLGLAGFAIAWREAGIAFGIGPIPGTVFIGITFGVFLVLLALYGVKTLRHRQAVFDEFHHPIQGNLFATATMTMMILASSLIGLSHNLATLIWGIAAIANMAITICVVTKWISQDNHISHATPIWFIPVVGNLVTPIIGAPLGYTDISWMVFAVGLIFWIILFTVVFYRLLFERAMEKPLRPTLTILIAPPSLCFIAYAVLNGGHIDGTAQMFFGIAVFMLLILIPQVRAMMQLPFGLSAWSYTFPMAAFSTAAILYADAIGGIIAHGMAVAAIGVTTLIIAVVGAKTIAYILAGKVFRPVETPLPTP
ncbi:MAG: SLAC1 anion channel family protein [Alphaproteobacteria bacterium]|nr:SLAC1 anion channel family protein [Alphaproteobacteria bacterium]